MARTPLFRAMRRALAAAASGGRAAEAGMTRRDVLRGSAAAAAWATSAFARTAAAAGAEQADPRIAIVGGGAAGLTAAYRLQALGLKPVVFEAADRWGGRIRTLPGFYRGLFAELGGELVDTRHEDLKGLVDELGLSLEPLNDGLAERDSDLYFFGGALRRSADMLDAKAGRGAFVPLAKQIAADKAALRDDADAFTDRARALDAISLADYVAQFRGKTEDWALDLILVAYTTEYGCDPSQQSCLNLIDDISTDLKEHFEIFGESDSAFRIKGGSAKLIDALVSACKTACDLRLGAKLAAIARRGEGLELTIETAGGAKPEVFDDVILALPFTCLRTVPGLDSLGLSDAKMQAIREMGYGNAAKLVCGTASRASRTSGSLPFPSNGAFFADLPFQRTWESSRAQRGKQGLLSNLLAGGTIPANQAAAFENLQKGLTAISTGIGAALDKDAVASVFWAQNPFSLGSFACAKVGQYTSFLPLVKTPELGGRLLFAGEHTEPDFLGTMNGAVMSGNRAAMELLMQPAP